MGYRTYSIVGTTSSVHDYALLPGNYPHQQGKLNYTSHTQSRLVTAHFVAVTPELADFASASAVTSMHTPAPPNTLWALLSILALNPTHSCTCTTGHLLSPIVHRCRHCNHAPLVLSHAAGPPICRVMVHTTLPPYTFATLPLHVCPCAGYIAGLHHICACPLVAALWVCTCPLLAVPAWVTHSPGISCSGLLHHLHEETEGYISCTQGDGGLCHTMCKRDGELHYTVCIRG